MSPVRPRIPVGALALTGMLAAALALAGCGAQQPEEPAPTATAQVNGLPDGVTLPEDVPVDVPNDPAARINVAIEDCAAVDGGWRAQGTALNPAADDVTYEVTVFFATDAGTVIGFGSTTVTVPGDGEAGWEITDDFVAPTSTTCVLRGAA